MVVLKLGVLLLFIGVGVFYVTNVQLEAVRPDERGRLRRLRVTGILRAAGVVFFAYVGFDAVSTAAAEAQQPAADDPDRPARARC